MLVFWWQGKGFLTPLIIAASIMLGAIVADSVHISAYTPGFWSVIFFVSAIANWIIGRRINAKRRKTSGIMSLSKQLTYRARHKFMSMPMETASVVLLAFALGNAAESILAR